MCGVLGCDEELTDSKFKILRKKGKTLFTLKVDEEIELSLVDRVMAPKMVDIILSEKAHLSKWLAWPELTKSIDDYLEYVAIVCKEYSDGKGMACNILFNGEPVGTIGFNYIDYSLKKAEIGYWLSEYSQGKGIMTRCCQRLIQMAFNELGLDKIEIPVAEGNTASRAVCERLGMISEGIIGYAENLNGRIVSHVYYALYRS